MGLYAVLWGKYKEYKDKAEEEIVEAVKDARNQMMIGGEDIEANHDVEMQKNAEVQVMTPTFAISAPMSAPPVLAVEALKRNT